jgi:hypothetical protein
VVIKTLQRWVASLHTAIATLCNGNYCIHHQTINCHLEVTGYSAIKGDSFTVNLERPNVIFIRHARTQNKMVFGFRSNVNERADDNPITLCSD